MSGNWTKFNEWPQYEQHDHHWPLEDYGKRHEYEVVGPKISNTRGLGWILRSTYPGGNTYWVFIEGHTLEQQLLAANWKKKRRKK